MESSLSLTGTSGAKQTIFYGETAESNRESTGGGVASEGEKIDVLLIPENVCESMGSKVRILSKSSIVFIWKKQLF